MVLITKNKSVTTKVAQKKKSTGPISAAGKAKSSKNAVLHGATSPQLLNDAEKSKYDTLLNELRESYPSTNPLVRMQLERIAKLNIQLERIQNTIDAQFLRSRALSRGYHELARHLDMDRETKSLALNLAMGFGGKEKIIDMDKIDISNELNYWVDSERPSTHEEFLDKTPRFCEYLFNESVKSQQTIKDYISDRVPKQKPEGNQHYSQGIDIRFVFGDEKPRIDSDIEEGIKNTELKELKRAAEWYGQEIMRMIVRTQKIADFRKLGPIEEQATTPDLDQLDRLMRYQTTIQRQLSTAIGELLALNKI